MKKNKILTAVYCSLLMIALGVSDALRGVFLPRFTQHFALSRTQSSMIIMISYVGNLLFLIVGGRVADRVSKKRFITAVTLMWLVAVTAYVFTDSYPLLLCCMIFSMGASTMLSTTVNLITPLVFAAPAFYVNIFNFVQGIGISGAQNIGGKFADSFSSWHKANAILLAAGVVSLAMLFAIKFPKEEKSDKTDINPSYSQVLKSPSCKYLILIFGFYCIAEHGLQNWLVTYGSEQLGFSVSRSALFLSLFFGGITLGRLLFAPLMQRFGIMKSMSVFVLTAGVLYILGIVMGRAGMPLICISGLAFSVLWPTLVLLTSRYYPKTLAGTATGLIIGASTLFDIAFNAFFGKAVELFGFGVSINVLPVSMALFCISFFALKHRVPIPEESQG